MGQIFEKITPVLSTFIEEQPFFIVATAAEDGRINVSAKGLDSFRILGPNRVCWMNLTGSGNETAAHILKNPRMTIMFNAISGPARTVRLYGTATMMDERDEAWAELQALFPDYAGMRQIFDVAIDSVGTACGMGMPEMTILRDRAADDLEPYFANMKEDEIRAYQERKNKVSIDGFETGI